MFCKTNVVFGDGLRKKNCIEVMHEINLAIKFNYSTNLIVNIFLSIVHAKNTG